MKSIIKIVVTTNKERKALGLTWKQYELYTWLIQAYAPKEWAMEVAKRES